MAADIIQINADYKQINADVHFVETDPLRSSLSEASLRICPFLFMFNNIFQYFIPWLIESCHSQFNGKLEVYKFQNRYFIKTGNVHQSGGWAESLYRDVFKRFNLNVGVGHGQPKGTPWRAPTKILLLGLAGGTLVKLLIKAYPNINIIGIDIDPVMINLGKKYFYLNEYKNLKIEIADAFEYVKKTKEKFDLVIVDIFKRDKVQIGTGDVVFLGDIMSIAINGGYVMINCLYLQNYKKETDAYFNFLKTEEKNGVFKIQDVFQNFGNKVILLRKEGKI